METSNGGDPPTMDSISVDWRTQLQSDSRQTIVNMIMDTLKRHIPVSGQEGLKELMKVAVRFEEMAYTAATSQSDYQRIMSLKMLTMETKSQNTMPNSMQSNSAGSAKNPADPDSTAQTGYPNGGDWQEEVYQKIKSMKDMYFLQLNEMYQKIVGKLQQHDSLPQQPKSEQLEKLKIFKTMLERLITFLQLSKSNILPGYKEKLGGYEKQIINVLNSNRPRKPVGPMQQGEALPPSHMNSMQQSHSQMTQVQPENHMNPQMQTMNMQGSVNTMQQNSKRSLQYNFLSPLKGVSNIQQHMMNPNQPGANVDPGQSSVMNSLQQVAVGAHHQSPVIVGDWREEVYQKIKSMKDTYYLELNEMYQKIAGKLQQHDSLPQQPKSEQLEKLKIFKTMLERLITFLQLSKSNILPGYKEKLGGYEKQIINVLNSNRPRKPVGPMQQGQALPPSHMNSMQQAQSQMTQVQQSKQQQEPQQQRQQHQQPQQQTPPLQANQLPQLHQVSDGNDMKIRKQMGIKPGAFQQHHLGGHRAAYHNQQLKSGASFPISSPQFLQAGSPHIPQHPSPQIDQQNLLNPLTKAGLQNANSPFIGTSPSTPLAPSSMPEEPEKVNSGISSLSNAGNIEHQQITGTVLPTQSLAIGTPGISALPLLAEFTSPDGHGNATTVVSGKSSITEQPLEHLLRVVKSMSPKASSSSVCDIGSVVSVIDRIAGSAPGNGSRAAVDEDLAAMTKCRLQARSFMSADGNSGMRKMKRFTGAMPLNVVSSSGSVHDSFKQLTGLEASELESTATSNIKRPRMEANHPLLEEIREINQRLTDTVVEISVEDVDPTAVAAASEGGEGTVVKCSFSAVALGPNLKSQYASAQMSPIQPLRLLIPTSYPSFSPILLDKFPVEVSEEYEDLSIKAKSRLSISLRTLSQPMSLGEIVRAWDVCARAVIFEYAQQSGGGSFSSKYGVWENC